MDDRAVDWERWSRPGPTPRQRRNDVLLGSAAVAVGVITTLLINSMGAFLYGTAPSLAEQLAWGIGLAAPLVVRRRFPAAVAVVVAVVFIAGQIRQVGDNLVPSIVLFLAIYTLGAWGRDRTVARWGRIGIIAAMFGWLGFSMFQAVTGPPVEFADAAGPLDPVLAATLYSVGTNLLFFLSAYYFGNVAWESARRERQLEVKGEQLRLSQEENARQAVVEERLRIARDLHDVVAHHVSVMGVQAAAARRVFTSDPRQASESLEAVENTARIAIGELRGLLGVLRAESPGDERAGAGAPGAGAPGDGHPSAPGLAQLGRLADETRQTGLRVEYATFGVVRPVPEALALSVYRVVQEALTNTVKHAAASAVDVRLRYLENALEIEVSDDGRGRPAVSAVPAGGGLGLVGMRERVAVHGGDLEIGSRRKGGFQVRARFPLPAAVSDAEPVEVR